MLEDESRRALRNLLPVEWIVRDKNPDYGLDMEIEIVEEGNVTNKVFWLQIKATETRQKETMYQMQTNHLKHYEGCRLPVVILCWVKPENTFYYVFAQQYIRETLSRENPQWREQQTAMVRFDATVESGRDLVAVATEGYFYVLQQQLNVSSEKSAFYWLDGIPRSDDREVRERTLKAFFALAHENYGEAIDELEKTLLACTASPTERMALLLSLGNAYYTIGRYDDALKAYRALFDVMEKVDERGAREGEAAALGNIGLIYSDKGEVDEALKYHKDALKIHREIGYKQGEANQLGNIGLIYSAKGEVDEALKYHKDALKIDREIGYKQGEASDLGNIGLIYAQKGDFKNALIHLQEALTILDTFNLVYGRDIICRAIDSIKGMQNYRKDKRP